MGGVLDAPLVFLESSLDAVPAQRAWVFQVVGALVALELDASGYRKIHGSGHQETRIESGGLAERGGEGFEMFCAISQRRYQKSVPRACMH